MLIYVYVITLSDNFRQKCRLIDLSKSQFTIRQRDSERQIFPDVLLGSQDIGDLFFGLNKSDWCTYFIQRFFYYSFMSDVLKIQVNFNQIHTKAKSEKLLKKKKKQIAKTYDILHIIVQHNKVRSMVLNATFNNNSVMSWLSILRVEATGVPRENHLPVTNH